MRTLKTVALLLVAICAFAADPPAADFDAKAVFGRLKALAGEWEANSSMGKVRLSYEVIAGGSALVQRETFEHMAPMMTVYHLDKDRLLLTHYCTTGNQPRMQARSFDPKTGELKFEFVDATNLASSAAGHMHAVKMRLGANQVAADWDFYEGGSRKMTESFLYSRVR
jgi:hypothetical protein